MRNTDSLNKIHIWLLTCAVLVLIITLIGGYTRLSGSGLSIVEWKPITGIIPPITPSDWLKEFTKYKNSPEYNLKNYGMSLNEFKTIFLTEYVHRIVGRLAGLLFFIPFLYYLFTRQLTKTQIISILSIGTLGLLQAFIGWYMVSSGLNKLPYVSHYRLALHLGTAIIIYSSLIWIGMPKINLNIRHNNIRIHLISLTIIIFIQIIIGAFVSGLKAGLIYNTFPLIGNSLIPQELWNQSEYPLDNPVFVQFIHRIIALLILLYSGRIFIKFGNPKNYIITAIFATTIFQVLLGILTLVLISPWLLALVHQFCAIILLTLLIISIKCLH